ncbi:hypothetical protein C8F01DRAFT_754104 [Mycena amicta]|nr:hypothetical protein C8F01DRAFT_754104 [Mycena amicta]
MTFHQRNGNDATIFEVHQESTRNTAPVPSTRWECTWGDAAEQSFSVDSPCPLVLHQSYAPYPEKPSHHDVDRKSQIPTTRQACSSSHQRCSERERVRARVTARQRFGETRTEGSVGPEGTTDALQNGEVLKNESWNEWVSRPVPKALPSLREGEDEPENTKLERSYQEPQAR